MTEKNKKRRDARLLNNKRIGKFQKILFTFWGEIASEQNALKNIIEMFSSNFTPMVKPHLRFEIALKQRLKAFFCLREKAKRFNINGPRY